MPFVSLCNKVLVSLKTQQDGNRRDARTGRDAGRGRGDAGRTGTATGNKATGNKATGRAKKPKKTNGIF